MKKEKCVCNGTGYFLNAMDIWTRCDCPIPLKKKSLSWYKKKCDKTFSAYIRKRDGRCLKCGKSENLQCAHIFSRRNISTRYDPDNAITLCYACHLHWAHRNPIDFTRFIENLIGKDQLDILALKSKKIVKMTLSDYEDIYNMLQCGLKDSTKIASYIYPSGQYEGGYH